MKWNMKAKRTCVAFASVRPCMGIDSENEIAGQQNCPFLFEMYVTDVFI